METVGRAVNPRGDPRYYDLAGLIISVLDRSRVGQLDCIDYPAKQILYGLMTSPKTDYLAPPHLLSLRFNPSGSFLDRWVAWAWAAAGAFGAPGSWM